MPLLLTKQLPTGMIRKQLLQDFALIENGYVIFLYVYLIDYLDFHIYAISGAKLKLHSAVYLHSP